MLRCRREFQTNNDNEEIGYEPWLRANFIGRNSSTINCNKSFRGNQWSEEKIRPRKCGTE